MMWNLPETAKLLKKNQATDKKKVQNTQESIQKNVYLEATRTSFLLQLLHVMWMASGNKNQKPWAKGRQLYFNTVAMRSLRTNQVLFTPAPNLCWALTITEERKKDTSVKWPEINQLPRMQFMPRDTHLDDKTTWVITLHQLVVKCPI